MAIIYNYDPSFHNIFIYDEEPSDLGERPNFFSDFADKQLIPKSRNPSFNRGLFDISGVNYTFARPFDNTLNDSAEAMMWDLNGSRKGPPAPGPAFDDSVGISDYISSSLNNFFRFPNGWAGFNTMRSGYPFGVLVSRKHLLVPKKLMDIWFDENRMMYEHPEKPYGSNEIVSDKIFFMGNSGETYEMTLTDSDSTDDVVNGVGRVARINPNTGREDFDFAEWCIIQFDSELPVGYKKYNNIIATELPKGTVVMIVMDNGKAIQAIYDGESFSDFTKKIRTSSIFLQDLNNEGEAGLGDDGFIFVNHSIFGTCLYHKTLSGLEFTLQDLQGTVDLLESTAYSSIQQFSGFFANILGFDDFPLIEIRDIPGQVIPFLQKEEFVSSKVSYTPPGKNPIFALSCSVTATNVEGIAINQTSENSVTGDGTGFNYQAPTSFTFGVYPPTSNEKTVGDQYPNNTDDSLKIYAYGSSGPIEQIRDDIVVGSTYSNALLQIETDFIPYKSFPEHADFVDFKYRVDVYVDGITHDSFFGRTDIPVTGDAERTSPYVPREYITGKFEDFGSSRALYPKYYFDLKWIKNFSHTQAGKTLSARLQYNAIDGSVFDSGIIDMVQIEPDILSVPTYETLSPPRDTVIEVPVWNTVVVETTELVSTITGFSSTPDIDDTSKVSVYIGKDREEGFSISLLESRNINQADLSTSFTFDIPNAFDFGDGLEATGTSNIWVVYEINHPATLLSELDNSNNSPEEELIADLVDPSSIVGVYSISEISE